MKVFVPVDGIPTVVLFTTLVSGSMQCAIAGVIHLSYVESEGFETPTGWNVQFAIPELMCSY